MFNNSKKKRMKPKKVSSFYIYDNKIIEPAAVPEVLPAEIQWFCPREYP